MEIPGEIRHQILKKETEKMKKGKKERRKQNKR